MLIDPIWLGGANAGLTGPGSNGVNNGLGPLLPPFTYTIVPTALTSTGIAGPQTTAASTAIAINGAYAASSTVVLDFPRAVSIQSAGDDSAVTFTFTGTDIYGQAMTETITGPNATTVTGKKAWNRITSIVCSAAVTTLARIGPSDVYGLPIAATFAEQILVRWAAGTGIDTSPLVAAGTTSNATSADVRGTVGPPASGSNGSRRLWVTITPTIAQATSANSSAGVVSLIGLPQA